MQSLWYGGGVLYKNMKMRNYNYMPLSYHQPITSGTYCIFLAINAWLMSTEHVNWKFGRVLRNAIYTLYNDWIPGRFFRNTNERYILTILMHSILLCLGFFLHCRLTMEILSTHSKISPNRPIPPALSSPSPNKTTKTPLSPTPPRHPNGSRGPRPPTLAGTSKR